MSFALASEPGSGDDAAVGCGEVRRRGLGGTGSP